MLAEIPVTEYRAAIDRCADDLLWEAGVGRPPVDAFGIAQRLGLVVTHDATLPGRARHVRLAPGDRRAGIRAIVLATEDRPERRQFAVAHEIGEAYAYRVYDSLGIDPRETVASAREGVANALAGHLLVPTKWLRGLWREHDGDLRDLKHELATASHELIARRVLECVRRPLVVTLTDQGRVSWRRWNLSGPAPLCLGLEAECQQHAHESGHPAWGDGRDEPHTVGGPPIERVRSWPIHEPGWRREITFTELYDDCPEWA